MRTKTTRPRAFALDRKDSLRPQSPLSLSPLLAGRGLSTPQSPPNDIRAFAALKERERDWVVAAAWAAAARGEEKKQEGDERERRGGAVAMAIHSSARRGPTDSRTNRTNTYYLTCLLLLFPVFLSRLISI